MNVIARRRVVCEGSVIVVILRWSMARSIEKVAPRRASERTDDGAGRPARATLIAEVLDALRFHGWFFCVSELTAPWALQLPGGRLAALHAVLEGDCAVTLAGGGSPVKLGPGDVVVLPRDDLHSISDREGRKPVPVSAIPGIDRRDRNATTFSHGGGGARTVVMTASFVADMRTAHAIVAGLPPVMVLRAGTAACARIAPVLSLVREEALQPGGSSAAVLRRSAEILFVQALREALMETRPYTGWLAAASDPRLAAAMAAIHAHPERRWTIAGLARLANLSRTAFFERFCASLGQTPADYLQWWRLQLAAQRLRETQDSVGSIALSVGYDNASAFARAFRRAMGCSPQAFRAGAGSAEPSEA
ncbi:MAG: AraC family transcriptional regulator [Alphaproteobacteria bacterium]